MIPWSSMLRGGSLRVSFGLIVAPPVPQGACRGGPVTDRLNLRTQQVRRPLTDEPADQAR